ncbi:MAG: mannitol-1-phosphate 5-dehydrogenase [Clostridia bacterium]|jgi:mannitol-1-phosphate 5-dehydrogenase
MKKAVMYGAGNIGRGFIGQLLSQSGYEVVFIDVNPQLVEELNRKRAYPIRFVSDKGNRELMIRNVRAVNGLDLEEVAKEISEADLMATAVGANVLSKIAPTVAKGLQKRWENQNTKPLNIIVCENLLDADHYLKSLIKEQLDEEAQRELEELVGFVEASIGRMVPVATPEMSEGNLLRICTEEYAELPVGKEGFKGEIPDIKNMLPYSPFTFYIQRKLFIHNMGHAVTAYLGQKKGYRYIWEAIGDESIRQTCMGAMMEAARALSKEHGVDLKEIQAYVEDLIARFDNRQLGDTIDRVGRDLQRKLAPKDRLVGALNLCIKHGIESIHICAGIAAALHFKDPAAGQVSALLKEYGPEKVLEELCSISRGSREWKAILDAYYAG